jgi:class 3 adenylate cyclase
VQPDTTAPVIVALLAVGMSLAFILADRRSRTSQAQALFLVFIGISIALDVLWVLPQRKAHGVVAWEGVFAIPQVLSFLFAYEWILRVRQTIPAGNLNTRWADRLLLTAQGLSLFYGLAALAFPEWRAEHFGNLTLVPGEKLHPSFWLFSVPLGVSLVLATMATLATLNRRPDRAEARRLIAFAIGAPIMAAAVVLPPHVAPLAGALGLLVLLVGSVQYHVTQGQRAQFLSRFLAPQVADLVTRRGLKSATDEKTLELSVVCCDLRGFTAFSAATSSRQVIAILREYYDAVGAAAAACGGTIKDQAGDGVLILVGAPIAFEDHGQRALELARQIRSVGVALTARWSHSDLQLGVGVGVASGFVTVGVIGGASRLEYTAVGSPVNLASRLCSEAAHGEILVDQRTVELLGASLQPEALRKGSTLHLKGFALPTPSYILATP